jgi:hypothetical protein
MVRGVLIRSSPPGARQVAPCRRLGLARSLNVLMNLYRDNTLVVAWWASLLMSAGGNCWELHPPFVLYRIRKRGITAAACRGPGRMRVLPPKSSKCRARNFTRTSRVRQGAASAMTLLPVSAKAPLSALTGGAENATADRFLDQVDPIRAGCRRKRAPCAPRLLIGQETKDGHSAASSRMFTSPRFGEAALSVVSGSRSPERRCDRTR